MIMGLQGAFSWLLVIIVLFFAGELVWKERSARINEVTDAMPVPNWVPLLAKFTALLAVIICFQAAGALAAMGVQLVKGYTHLEPLLYLRSLAMDSVIYLLMGGLALVLQVLTNNKFLGYALLIVVMIGQGVLGMLDYTQNLYNFGGWPNAPYSDMNGYGHFLPGQLAFQGYWALFLLTLMCLASAFWVRGVSQGLRQRLALVEPPPARPDRRLCRTCGIGLHAAWAAGCTGAPISATSSSRPTSSWTSRPATSASCRSTAPCRSRASWQWTTAWTCSRNRSRW